MYFYFFHQTTYENFRYRTDSRLNVYNRGCVNNYAEVFCTSIKPSRNKFRAFAQEEVQQTPPLRTTPENEIEIMDDSGDQRTKVHNDLDFGGDLLKISQRHNIEDIEDDIRSRGSNLLHNSSETDSHVGSDYHTQTIRADIRHSSWGRSRNFEIGSDISTKDAHVHEG